MEQRLRRSLMESMQESMARQMGRVEDDPPAMPVECFVLMLPERQADLLRDLLQRGTWGVSTEQVAERLLADRILTELKEEIIAQVPKND